MVREIANTFPHAELMDTWTWFQSGLNTDGAHNPVTSRKIERGDILRLNCFPMPDGYYTALEHTLFAEECSDDHLRMWEGKGKVHDGGKALRKAGTRENGRGSGREREGQYVWRKGREGEKKKK